MKNKSFVKMMMLIAIVSSTILILLMFRVIKQATQSEPVTKDKNSLQNIQKTANNQETTMIGRIETREENQIFLWNLQKEVYEDLSIAQTTQVKDESGKQVPVATLKVGELVAVKYDEQKQQALEITKKGIAWTKTGLTEVVMDPYEKKIYVGNESYEYTLDTMFLDQEEKKSASYLVGKYDKIELTGIGQTVYTVKRLQQQGELELMNLPSKEGVIEIDTSRQINLEQINAPIAMPSGKHKVVVQMEGYELVLEEVVIEEAERVVLDLGETDFAYTEILIEVLNGVEDYKVEIGGHTFYKGEPMKIKQGNYLLKVSADGFVDWLGNITLKEEKIRLQITLQQEQEQEEEKESEPQTEEETDLSSSNAETGNKHTIHISTDPEGATLFINGVNKGETPYTTTLEVGAYDLLLQKEGYEPYTSSIMLDNSDDQNSHLYILTPK